MAAEFAEKARDALIDDEYETAVDLYNKAIDSDPANANLFADRAQAQIKLLNLTEAVSDSSKAIELNPSLPKAYLRKGSACMKLEEYRTAKAALEAGASLAPNDSRFSKLIEECNKNIADDQEKLQTPIVAQGAEPAPVAMLPSNTITESIKATENGSSSLQHVDAVEVVKPKYRHDFYQHPGEVVVSILAKGKAEEDVVIEFGEQILSVNINEPGEDAYLFQSRLFGKIIPEKCRYEILPSKIEIRLVKAESINWKTLEYSKQAAVPQKINDLSVVSHRPSYPSSKNRAADWDKLEAQVKKEEKEEKLDGDAALNKFFREIYHDADEDARRAMMKSFVESNGTVLSTNWKDVGSKKVEGSPPDGMELKKWEY